MILLRIQKNKKFYQKFLLTVVTIFFVNVGFGQVLWGNTGASTAWYTAGNWSPSTASTAWTTSSVAQFANTGTATTAGINLTTSSLSIGAIEITSARTRILTIGSSATSGSLTLNGATINSISNVVLRNNSGFALTLQNNETGTGKTMNVVLGSTNNVFQLDAAGSILISSVISGTSKNLIKGGNGSGILNLSGSNTYSGNTSILAGTLALSGSGSIANSPVTTIASGANFDVSGLSTALTLGTSQSLSSAATGSNTTATITVISGKGITLSAGGLNFSAYGGGSIAPITVNGISAGNLILNNAPISLVTTTALATGTYKLIAKGGSASVTGTPGSLTVSGSGLASGTTGALSVVNGELILTVTSLLQTVTFNANGGTGSMSSQNGSTAANLTSNSFTRSGYTFSGWNTVADGSGTSYVDGASFPFTSSVTLYAQWSIISFTVSFNANGGSGSMLSQSGSTAANLISNTFIRSGYSFTAWNSAADGSGVTYTNGANYAFNANITLYAQWVLISTPTITVNASLTALSTTYGSASSTVSFTVSGSSLNADILVSAPVGFQVSLSSINNFSSSILIPPSSGSVTTTPVYLRLSSTSNVGVYSGAISISSTGATTVNLATISSTVNPAILSVSGLSSNGKIYDGNTSVSVIGTASFLGLQNGDFFTPVVSVSWSFPFPNIGLQTLIQTGTILAPNSNYVVSQPNLTATITPKALTVTNITGINKIFDNTSAATFTGTLQGLVATDNVNLIGTGTFVTVNVGTGISITSTATLGGTDAGNYTLIQPTGILANITQAPQTITFSALLTKIVGASNFNLSATSSSGLTVTYTSSNTSVAMISGSTVTIVGAGTTIITASQVGNANYAAALDVAQNQLVLTAPWEDFETGTKTAYALASVVCSAGSWNMNGALIGTSASDKKNGSQSVRIQSTGSIEMNFDFPTGLGTVSVAHAAYGNDALTSTWRLEASTNGGVSWNAYISPSITSNSVSLTIQSFVVNLTGNVRFRIVKLTGGSSARINFDDFYVSSFNEPEINLQGNGISIISGDLTPSLTDQTDFGNSAINGGTITRTFTIQNSGPATLNLTSGGTFISISGDNASDFTLTLVPSASINSGLSTTFQVTFNPSIVGLSVAKISIASNDSDENPYIFAIQGTGVNTTISYVNNLTALSAVYGSFSNVSDFSISGSALVDNIVLNCPSGFQISTSPVSGFASSLILIPIGEVIPSMQIYVRLDSINSAGSYSGDIVVASTGVSTLNIAIVNSSVTPRALTVIGAVGINKIYDNTSNATFTGTLNGILNSDQVVLVGNGIFDSPNVGNGIGITATASLSGLSAQNYYLVQPLGITANILQASQTISFGVLIDRVVGTSNFNLTASASSGLPIVYVSSNPTVATVTGNTVTIIGVGATTITASQSGNLNYGAALDISQIQIIVIQPWEDFEVGVKGSYSIANVTCSAGNWSMQDALIGTLSSDKKNGNKSVRIQNNGNITMNFDIIGGLGTIKLSHAAYGTDALSSSWRLEVSSDGGINWNAYVSPIISSNSSALKSETIQVDIPGNVRFRILKISGGSNRINFDDLTITPFSPNPLPVELISFSATCNANRSIVHWTTGSENKSAFFLLESSLDLIHWKFIDQKNAAGNSSQKIDYESEDFPTNQITYYRLSQVDLDGTKRMYSPISVWCKNDADDFEIFPNPTQNDFEINIPVTYSNSAFEIQIFSSSGRLIVTKNIFVSSDSNVINLKGLNLTQGVYYVHFVTSNYQFDAKKLIVQ